MLELVLRETSTGNELSTFELRTSGHIFSAVLKALPEGSMEHQLISLSLDADTLLCKLSTSPITDAAINTYFKEADKSIFDDMLSKEES